MTAAQKPAPSIGLKAIEGATAKTVFADGGVASIIKQIDAEVRPAKIDLSTKAGRDAINSAAYKVTRATTILDDLGKDSVADLKKRAAAVDAKRRELREGLTTLRDDIRAPLTKYEEEERARVDGHEATMADLALMLANLGDRTSAEIEDRLRELGEIAQRDWQEYEARAVSTIDHIRAGLQRELAAARQREADQAELERLRQEAAERARKDHEEQIAREAADRARREAEEKAQAERDRIEQEKAEAEERAARAERQRIADAEAAERAAVAAAEQAERERQEAIEAERQRQANEIARQEAETKRREANKRHAAKINSEVLAAIVACGVDAAVGKAIVTAIVRGEVPHTKIFY